MRIVRGSVVCMVFALGCEQKAAAPPAAASATPAPLATDTWKRPPCSEIFARYRKALSAARNTCRADAECARYGGVDPENVCGGVIDAETARDLTRIAEDPAGAACPRPGYSCPPLEPHCVSGLCR